MAANGASIILANPCKFVYCGDYVFFCRTPAGKKLFLANNSH